MPVIYMYARIHLQNEPHVQFGIASNIVYTNINKFDGYKGHLCLMAQKSFVSSAYDYNGSHEFVDPAVQVKEL